MDKKILFENFITTYLKKHCSKNCIDIDLHIDLKKLILKEMENATKKCPYSSNKRIQRE